MRSFLLDHACCQYYFQYTSLHTFIAQHGHTLLFVYYLYCVESRPLSKSIAEPRSVTCMILLRTLETWAIVRPSSIYLSTGASHKTLCTSPRLIIPIHPQTTSWWWEVLTALWIDLLFIGHSNNPIDQRASHHFHDMRQPNTGYHLWATVLTLLDPGNIL